MTTTEHLFPFNSHLHDGSPSAIFPDPLEALVSESQECLLSVNLRGRRETQQDMYVFAWQMISNTLPGRPPAENSKKAAWKGDCKGNIHEDDIKFCCSPKQIECFFIVMRSRTEQFNQKMHQIWSLWWMILWGQNSKHQSGQSLSRPADYLFRESSSCFDLCIG